MLILPTGMFAMNCTSTPGFDLQEFVTVRCGPHSAEANIIVDNTYCNFQNGTLTMEMSPKYGYNGATMAPASVAGNTISWNFTGILSSVMAPALITVPFELSPWLPQYLPGDTVNSNYHLTPIAGDAMPASNIIINVDTVKSGFDPNYVEVVPNGIITAGTTLQYTIGFENTGNDTAHNIYVLDTLADYLDKSSLRLLIASHTMNVSSRHLGTTTIMKFDFPTINLLDSSHHDACHGTFIYTIKTKTDLPYGTLIPNRAGIYFDSNPVVMTNTAYNLIATPTGISEMNKDAMVSMYPNPTTNELMVKTLKGDFKQVTITSSVGNVLIQHDVTGSVTQIDVTSLSAGIYYVTLTGAAGIKMGKFVKL